MKRIKSNTGLHRPHSRNVIPAAWPGAIGPYIYFDHLGPFEFPAGREVYIPPHPHTGIATLSYMFEGEGHHRDSLGNDQVLHARRLNYMNAGNGIIHSEGLSENFTKMGGRLSGVQIWFLLSAEERENGARFQSFSETELPGFSHGDGFISTVLVGTHETYSSPVVTHRQLTLMTLASGTGGSSSSVLLRDGWEYLLYVCDGSLHSGDQLFETGEGFTTGNSTHVSISTQGGCKAILMGGPMLNEQPMFNGSFVSVGSKQMEGYIARYSKGQFGILR
jgi:redox-sensitive bicupin YhaK (pirin superfamily)